MNWRAYKSTNLHEECRLIEREGYINKKLDTIISSLLILVLFVFLFKQN